MPSETTPLPPIKLDELFTVEGFSDRHKNISVAMLRWQLRHRETNGLAPATVKAGKKILIHEPRYEIWFGAKAGVAA